MPFLIDGYNVYHTARKLSEEWSRITPHLLCAFVAEDMDRLRERGIIVFDGNRLPGQLQHEEGYGLLEVVCSGARSDADTTLEELIQANTAPRRLTVVSTDRRLRRAARRRRATSLSSIDYFMALLRRADQPQRRPSEPREKRRGVAEGELRQWLDLFDIDPDQSPEEPFE